ncbi:XRE family transcriptional regulator [Streptococcus sp. S784/96/1]|uniref:XRE family transcriptional regulator n=1 Tax=Streptococcus sp. S784/96/1 TaxID=2653499 RepID=UPI00138A5A49|nr:XRE family transcriptional regulator [Streptococcus sp. S784/96/1]
MTDKELALYIGNKIKEYRKIQGLTQKELAEKVGMGDTTIANYEKGFRTPKKNTLFKLANAFDISIDDLFPPIEKTTPPHTSDSLVTAINDKVTQLTTERRKNVLRFASDELDAQKAEEQGTDVEEPMELYSVLTTTSLAAGVGYAFNDYDQETVYVGNRPPRHDLASFISGDSMEPKYHNGDIVYLVDKGFSSYSGEICAVAVNNKTYLKRVYTEKGQLRLVSINPKYDDIYIDFPPTDGHIRIYSVVGTDSIVEN